MLLVGLISCSKDETTPPPPPEIPNILNGDITTITVNPIDIVTPDKATLLISVQNSLYKVDFNASEQAQSNAVINFATDTILSEFSREFANLGMDEIAYNPLNPNDVTITFNDGRKVFGRFTIGTTFGGTFGRNLIEQWREPNDPSKPNQKAKTDLLNFIQLYGDRDGAGPETDPTYLSVTITRQ